MAVSEWPTNRPELHAASVAYNQQAGLLEEALQGAFPLVEWHVERHDLSVLVPTVGPDAFQINGSMRKQGEPLVGVLMMATGLPTDDGLAMVRSLLGPEFGEAVSGEKPGA